MAVQSKTAIKPTTAISNTTLATGIINNLVANQPTPKHIPNNPQLAHVRKYISILRKFGIAYKSVSLSFDETSQTKKCIHPQGWQNTTIATSSFDYLKNALIQITGPIGNTVDGLGH